ncbi:MAG: hypothetical protein ABL958_16030, partial [Bdellovibrionia bacterium]
EVAPEPEATPLPSPSATPEPEPEPTGKSVMPESDHKYALYLEKVLARLPPTREERMIVDYIRYLHYGEKKYATAYMDALKKEATQREGLVPNVDVFEGAYVYCHFEKDMCVRSIGALTSTYLVPRLKSGDPVALELFVVHGGTTDRDGAEAETYDEVGALPDVEKHTRAIAEFKKKYRKLFQSIQ